MTDPLVPARGWLLYDGQCGICSTGVARGSGFLHGLGLQPAALQEPWVQERTGLSAEALLTDVTLLTTTGQVLRGAAAYRWILARRWWTWPLWLLAVVPPTRWLFAGGYRLVARHRRRISHVCRIAPR